MLIFFSIFYSTEFSICRSPAPKLPYFIYSEATSIAEQLDPTPQQKIVSWVWHKTVFGGKALVYFKIKEDVNKTE